MEWLDISALTGNWPSKMLNGSKWYCVVALVELAILNSFSVLDKRGR